jgi:hypothetical protein
MLVFAIGFGVWITFCILLTILNPTSNNPTKNMLPCLLALVVIFTVGLLTTVMAEPQTTFRDAGGRTIGTAATDSQGTTTFRDAGGRTTGTATGVRK